MKSLKFTGYYLLIMLSALACTSSSGGGDGASSVSSSVAVSFPTRPVLNAITYEPKSIVPGAVVQIVADYEDPDIEDGDKHTFRWLIKGVEQSGTTATITWVAPDRSGSYLIECTVRDLAGYTDIRTQSMYVNKPPVVAGASTNLDSEYLPGEVIALTTNSTITLYLDVSDPEGDPTTISWSASGGVFIEEEDSFAVWKASGITSGNYEIIAAISDGRTQVLYTFEVEVLAIINDPPRINTMLPTVVTSFLALGERATISVAVSDDMAVGGDVTEAELWVQWEISPALGTVMDSTSDSTGLGQLHSAITWQAPDVLGSENTVRVTCTALDNLGGVTSAYREFQLYDPEAIPSVSGKLNLIDHDESLVSAIVPGSSVLLQVAVEDAEAEVTWSTTGGILSASIGAYVVYTAPAQADTAYQVKADIAGLVEYNFQFTTVDLPAAALTVAVLGRTATYADQQLSLEALPQGLGSAAPTPKWTVLLAGAQTEAGTFIPDNALVTEWQPPLRQDDFTLAVVLSDDQGRSAVALHQATVLVGEADMRIVANANQAYEGGSVELEVIGEGLSSIEWQVSAGAELSSTDGPTTVLTAPVGIVADTQITVSCSATNEVGALLSDLFKISLLKNTVPIIESIQALGAIAEIVYIGQGQQYQLIADINDPDVGQEQNYDWGISPEGATFSTTLVAPYWAPTAAGLYQVTLNFDDGSYQGDVSKSISISAVVNAPPVIDEFNIPAEPVINHVYELTMVVTDADNAADLTYVWFVDDEQVAGEVANAFLWTAPATTGDHKIACTVYDGRGASASIERVVHVYEFEQTFLRFFNTPYVKAMLPEDSFIWVGSATDGLARYNSQNFSASYFSLGPDINVINDIQKIAGRIYILHNKGIHYFAGQAWAELPGSSAVVSEDALNGDAQPLAILEADDGYLWIGTRRGLYKYDPNSTYFAYTYQTGIWERPEWVNALAYDNYGALWAGSEIGAKYLADNGLWMGAPTNPANQNAVSDLTLADNGMLWVATSRGLGMGDGYGLGDWAEVRGANIGSIDRDRCSAVALTQSGEVWVGHPGEAASYRSPDGEWHMIGTKDVFYHDSINALVVDEADTVWFGSGGFGDGFVPLGGVNFLRSGEEVENINAVAPISNQTTEIITTPDGLLYVGTDRGVAVYDTSGWYSKLYFDLGQSEFDAIRYVNTMVVRNGDVLYGTNGYVALQQQDSPREAKKVENAARELVSVNKMRLDADNNLWMGTTDGVRKLTNLGGITSLSNSIDSVINQDNIGSYNVLSLAVDATGTVWLGTDNGLNMIHAGSGKIVDDTTVRFGTPAPIAGAAIYDLTTSTEGGVVTVYMATSVGFVKLQTTATAIEPSSDSWSVATTADGLPSDSVYSLLLTADGRTILGTDAGLAVSVDSAWEIYDVENGLVGANITGLHIGADGRLWVGTVADGISCSVLEF